MKKSLITSTLLSLLASSSFAAVEMSSAVPQDNQCRVQAKEIALQTYQTCVTETRTAKIEQIRKEYQDKIAELKSKYEAQISELKSANAVAPVVVGKTKPQPQIAKAPVAKELAVPQNNEVNSVKPAVAEPSAKPGPAVNSLPAQETPAVKPAPETTLAPKAAPEKAAAPSLSPAPETTLTPAPVSPEAVVEPETLPTTLIDETPAVIEPAKTSETIESQDLTLTEPTVTLKPAQREKVTPAKNASTKIKSKKKSTPVVTAAAKGSDISPKATKKIATKTTKKSAPVVAQKRAKGEKGVKGIAKTLPSKQKPVETKPASEVITENQTSKIAPIESSDLEKSQITQAPLEELNTERTVIDEGLSGAQADSQLSQ